MPYPSSSLLLSSLELSDAHVYEPYIRALLQVAYPDVNGVLPRLSSVSRSESSSGVSWLLSVSSQDCRPPNLDFSVHLSAADASADATVSRVHDHAPALTGEVVVEFKGEFARFSPYASGTP